MAEALIAPPPGFELTGALPQPPDGFVAERRARPRLAADMLDAIRSGFQGSATGLALRRGLPDVVLDPYHSTWYEKALAGTTQVLSELPLMIGGGAAGTIAGGGAGTAVAGPVGTAFGGVMGMGAGAFAVPAAIRTTLVESYKAGTADSSGGFLASTAIILKQTAKEAVIGALTMGAGAVVGRVGMTALAPSVGQSITAQTAIRAVSAASTGAELTSMVIAPAALEGKLPEWEDFLNAAIVLGGVKASMKIAGKIGDIYAKTGVRPEDVVGAARIDPKIVEELKAETSELPKAFERAANDENARNAILDPKAARAFVQNPFTEVPQAPGTPKIKLNVNYDYWNSPEEVKTAMARAVELYGPTILEQTRGEVSWTKTEQDAAQRLGEMTGVEARKFFENRTPGTPEGAIDLELRSQALAGAVADFTTKARTYDELTGTPQQAIEMMAAAERVAMTSAFFTGASSEAGRTLNYLKKIKELTGQGEAINKLLADAERSPAEIARIMKEIDNPVAAAKVARALVEATPWEKIREALRAAMISGPVSWGANVIGNVTFLPLRPVIDLVSIPIGVVRGNAEHTILIEPVARIVGNWQGAVDAIMAAGSFLRIYGTQPMEGLRQLDRGLTPQKYDAGPRGAIKGDLGVAVRSAFLPLSIPDVFFRMMIERGEANTIAAHKAAAEGLTVGSREFSERMAAARETFTKAEQKQISDMGARGTFNANLGEVGTSAQKLINKMGPVGFVVAPFTRTPLNIAKELVRLTPAAPIINTWRADIAKGGPARDKALAEILVGTTIMSVTFGLAQSG